jgi:hypothetical protein
MNSDNVEFNENEVSRTTAIGRALEKFSAEAEFSAQRGVVADLYPYIVTASKRMSARAIARFLEEEHKVKISPVTIAKAIRNPKKYWMFFFDSIEPYARKIEEAHNISMLSLLFQEEVFEMHCHTDEHPEHLVAGNAEEFEAAEDDYREAVGVIMEKWFGLSEELRRDAQGYLEKQLTEFQKAVNKEKK